MKIFTFYEIFDRILVHKLSKKSKPLPRYYSVTLIALLNCHKGQLWTHTQNATKNKKDKAWIPYSDTLTNFGPSAHGPITS